MARSWSNTTTRSRNESAVCAADLGVVGGLIRVGDADWCLTHGTALDREVGDDLALLDSVEILFFRHHTGWSSHSLESAY